MVSLSRSTCAAEAARCHGFAPRRRGPSRQVSVSLGVLTLNPQKSSTNSNAKWQRFRRFARCVEKAFCLENRTGIRNNPEQIRPLVAEGRDADACATAAIPPPLQTNEREHAVDNQLYLQSSDCMISSAMSEPPRKAPPPLPPPRQQSSEHAPEAAGDGRPAPPPRPSAGFTPFITLF